MGTYTKKKTITDVGEHIKMGYEAIYIQNQKYNYYESYKTWNEALKQAKYKKKKTKTKYYIQPVEEGFLFPAKRYRLYFNKVMRLQWT